MTFSPLFNTLTESFVVWYCSATSGLMLLLKPPVPLPMTISAMTKHASAPFGLTMTVGIDDIIKRICPKSAIATETHMVLYRPQ